MTVEQMKNRQGRAVPNQFILKGDNKLAFQSYESPIVELDYDNYVMTIGKDYKYSRTTGKYRNLFFEKYANLPELATAEALEQAIKDGSFLHWTIKEGDR